MKKWPYLFFIAFFFLFSGQRQAFSISLPEDIPPPPTITKPSPVSSKMSQPHLNISSDTKTSPLKTRFKKKSKPSSLMKYAESLLVKYAESHILFQWLNEQQLSFQWAYGFLKQKDKFAPVLLKERINNTFRNDTIIYLNFHQNILQFPYILKWGLKASAGLTLNKDNKQTYFFPLSLTMIVHLQIFKHQFIVPFFEMGYSTWNIDFSEFSDYFPVWHIGTTISLSLFKNSLRHTLPDEYGIQDIGIILEVRNHSSPTDLPDEKRGYFLHSLHTGLYFKF